MNLYKNEDIEINIIIDEDIPFVLDLFQKEDFNCDYETGVLRPLPYEFKKIMQEVIAGDQTEAILVLKKRCKVIGYVSCYITYDRLTIGHIVVSEKEKQREYKTLLTSLVLQIASNDDREVSIVDYCRNNSYLYKLGFETKDHVHYYWKQKLPKNDFPSLFLTIKQYQEKQNEKVKKDLERWSEFLKSEQFESLKSDVRGSCKTKSYI